MAVIYQKTPCTECAAWKAVPSKARVTQDEVRGEYAAINAAWNTRANECKVKLCLNFAECSRVKTKSEAVLPLGVFSYIIA